MESSIVTSVSLIAAFLAGMVALFAPCCITFLLPAYLGSVFKERKRVLLMTLVFGAGIFVVLMPAVLGVSLISKFVFRYHDITYYLGGVVMIVVGILALWGIKLPMPNIARQREAGDKPDVVSIFTLGVFSGLTSACCAPVLVGALALTLVSPSFWMAILTGGVYVLGMVAPLLVSGYFIDAQKIFNRAVFGKKVGRFVLSNLIAAGIFIPMGVLILFLTITGRLSMETSRHYAQTIQNTAATIDNTWKKMWGGKAAGVIEGSKTAQSGDITITAEPREGEFSLQLDTHTTELDFDIEAMVTMADDAGTDYGKGVWTGSAPGGHHRRGTLKFDKPIEASAQKIILRLSGSNVMLEWEVVR